MLIVTTAIVTAATNTVDRGIATMPEAAGRKFQRTGKSAVIILRTPTRSFCV